MDLFGVEPRSKADCEYPPDGSKYHNKYNFKTILSITIYVFDYIVADTYNKGNRKTVIQ